MNAKKMLRYVKNPYFFVGKLRSSPRDGTQLDAFKLQCFHTLMANDRLLEEKVDAFVDMVALDMRENGVRLVWETSEPESQESDEEREVFHAEEPSLRRVLAMWVSASVVPFMRKPILTTRSHGVH